MIRKVKDGYRIFSRKKNPKTGKRRNLGTFDSISGAKKHEREIEYFKHHEMLHLKTFENFDIIDIGTARVYAEMFCHEYDWTELGPGMTEEKARSMNGLCGDVSRAFIKWLGEKHGEPALVLQAHFDKGVGTGNEFDGHACVVLDESDITIDLTIGQFYIPQKVELFIGAGDSWEDELNRILKPWHAEVEDADSIEDNREDVKKYLNNK